MADLEYSIDALNVKSAFYRANTMVYVEGQDDVLFWEEIFSPNKELEIKVESVGGSAELDKIICDIESNGLKAIAARDADHLRFVGNISKNPRVIYTFGYSIENSMYTAELIHSLIRVWCKTSLITIGQCQNWLNDLSTSLRPLVALDIANAYSKTGIAVVPDNCTRYMVDQKSEKPSNSKINIEVKKIEKKLAKKALLVGEKAMNSSPHAPSIGLRGHFLSSAVIKFVSQTAKALKKQISISYEAMYTTAILSFSNIYNHTHPHFEHYSNAVIGAATTFKKA